jgi:ATP-dependent RNA helicase RhlB
MPQTHLTDTRFDSFELDQRILAGLADAGFTYCTPIQAATLPIGLAGRDVAGQAQTGTGKTAAYLLVALQRLLAQPVPPPTEGQGSRSRPRVVVLAPTRELAVQIHKDAVVLAAHTGFRLGVVYGGTGYQQQRDQIAAGVDILIGTPGRLIDYFKQRVFDLKAVEVVVLDEADRMFDLGFIKDVRFLLRRCPPPQERLGLLFSATMSLRVNELAYEHMNNPQLVQVEPEKVTADKVRQLLYHTSNEEKIPLLLGLMKKIDASRSIVFVNTKRDAERVWSYLEGNGYSAAILSGDVPQRKRQSLLKQFQAGELAILVATDVAARGLHIPDVSHVFNYDLPQEAEDYVHRIGRTARLGADGDAISFACERFVYSLPEIEAFVGHPIPVEPVRDDILVEPAPPAPRPRRHTGPGKRPTKGGQGRGATSGTQRNRRGRRSGR